MNENPGLIYMGLIFYVLLLLHATKNIYIVLRCDHYFDSFDPALFSNNFFFLKYWREF